jgi:hypothetical protein
MPQLQTLSLMDNPLPDKLQAFCKTQGLWVENVNHPAKIDRLKRYLQQNPSLNVPMAERQIQEFRNARGPVGCWYKVKRGYWDESNLAKEAPEDWELSRDLIREAE